MIVALTLFVLDSSSVIVGVGLIEFSKEKVRVQLLVSDRCADDDLVTVWLRDSLSAFVVLFDPLRFVRDTDEVAEQDILPCMVRVCEMMCVRVFDKVEDADLVPVSRSVPPVLLRV